MAAERQRPDLKFQGLDPSIIVQALQQQQQIALQKEQQKAQQQQQLFNNITSAAQTGFSLANQAQKLAETNRKGNATDKIVDIISQQEQAQTAQLQSFTAPQPGAQIDTSQVPVRPAFTTEELNQPILAGDNVEGPSPFASLQSDLQQFTPTLAPQGSPERAEVDRQLGQVQQTSQIAQAQAVSDPKLALQTAGLAGSAQDTLSPEAAELLGDPRLAGLEEDEAKVVLESLEGKQSAKEKALETKQKIEEGKISTATGLRKEFINQSKSFTTSAAAMQRIRALSKAPRSAANDIAFVFNFMKANDPGSVVRESEFRTAAEAKAWVVRAEDSGFVIPSAIKQIIQKIDPNKKGAFLLPSQIKEFASTSETAFSGTEKQQKKLEREYRRIAKEIDVSPTQVVVDLKPTRGSGKKKTPPRAVQVNGRTFKVRRK